MKRLDFVLLKIFLYGLPGVIVLAVFSSSRSAENITRAAPYVRLLYNSSGLVFGLWIALAVYLSVRLMLSWSFREKVLTKLTFMKERDEREVALTGKASKATLLMSIAVLVFLFFLSCFQVSVFRVPPEKAIQGKTGMVTLGFRLNLLEGSKERETGAAHMQKTNIFSYTGLPISSTAVILLLIAWQIALYNYTIRRQAKGRE
jgi:hypothetical protein